MHDFFNMIFSVKFVRLVLLCPISNCIEIATRVSDSHRWQDLLVLRIPGVCNGRYITGAHDTLPEKVYAVIHMYR